MDLVAAQFTALQGKKDLVRFSRESLRVNELLSASYGRVR